MNTLLPEEIKLESQRIQSIIEKYKANSYQIIDLFLESEGFEGIVVYNDKPNSYFDYHYHNVDFYVYIISGSMVVGYKESGDVKLGSAEFHLFPAKKIHNATISEDGCKYIVATKNGEFDAVFIETGFTHI